MVTDDPQERFADELLSAYLDGELTGSERAEVEARLADDPAAQQTLEELRAVSRVVRDLPHEQADRGLSAAVLARLESARQDTIEATTTTTVTRVQSDSDAPSVSFGRSRRGWVWAALAVAAALAIMIYQPMQPAGDDQELARRDRSARLEELSTATDAPEMEELRRTPAVDRAAGDRFGGGAVGGAASDSGAADASVEWFDNDDAAPPLAASPTESELLPPTAAPELGASSDVSAPSPRSVATVPAPVDTLSSGRTFAAADVLTRSNALLVRVSMPASSRRAMQFERTLGENQIILEDDLSGLTSDSRNLSRGRGAVRFGADVESVASDESTAADTNEREADDEDTPSRTSRRALAEAVEENQPVYRAQLIGQEEGEDGTPVDVIVVNAPPLQVFGCISDIRSDESNFTAVEVETADSPSEAAGQQQAANAPTYDVYQRQQQFTPETLRPYNRGQVPMAQKSIVPRSWAFVQQQAEVAQRSATQQSVAQQPAAQQQSAQQQEVPLQAYDGANAAGNQYRYQTNAAAAPLTDEQIQVFFFLGTEPNGAPSPAKKARAD